MTKRIFAAVLLLCLFVSVVYAQSAATVFGWPPADGSVTNAKLAEPVSVANGGTGKTTAAEALAALGGASLNGSSTVAFHASIYNAATGTAAAPAYSFSSDPDTGIYSAGGDVLGFGVGGTENARFVGGKLLIATSTDAGAYPLQNNGYLWSSGYDLPRGTRMGWASKDDTFTLNGVDTAQNGVTFGPTAGDYVTSAGYFGLNFATQSVERARITSGGNVLIATSTDDGKNKLQVNGSMRLIGGAAPAATEGAIYFNSTDKHFYGYNGTAWVQLDN